jgi:hypothetical protein
MAGYTVSPKGSEHPNWKGGRVIDKNGYVHIYKPNHPHAVGLYVSEHRLIMENKLGRILSPSEIVHHINGIKNDNREDNLELTNTSKHMEHHRLLIWSEYELATLRANYRELSQDILQGLLPDKTWNAITLKAERLGLSRERQDLNNPRRHSTIKELATIYLYYPYLTIEELQKKIPNVKRNTIKSTARLLGVCK